jgi:glutathione S-transferase
MLHIHGSARSRAQRILWMAFELGIPFEHDDILPRSPGTKTPAFLELNPNARLPVIEDDGFVLYESMAINFYLAKKHKSPLYPADPRAEALALQWSFWETDRLDRQLANYLTHTSILPEAERDKSIADAAWADVEPAMSALNGALAKAPWLAGPDFSIADLNVAAALWRGLSMDLSLWPAVRDWLARCWDRPAGKKARAMREG